MTERGDIHIADLNEERRRRVLVVSGPRFHRASGRVLVVPEILSEPHAVPLPWRIASYDAIFAVDLVRSIAAERLLERTDRATAATMDLVRRAIAHIT